MIKNLLSRLKTGPQACLRPLVLDMDWYRWDLGPFWKKLPKAPEFNRQFRYQRLRQDEVITAAIRGEARSYTKRRISSINDVIELEYKGLNLWQIARGCILAHANVPHQKYLTTDHLEKTIEIISSVITVIDSLPAWFNLLNPHAVIVYEGTRSLSRAIIEIARQNRIKTIARNEVQTINAQISLRRSESLGIKKGIYLTSGDERVRPCHKELDGVEYDLSKGAWSKKCQKYIQPGITDINCRCSFRPVIEVD